MTNGRNQRLRVKPAMMECQAQLGSCHAPFNIATSAAEKHTSMEPDSTPQQSEVERRTRGRAHTSHLLHMLRGGYSAVVEPAALAPAPPIKVAETPNVYPRTAQLISPLPELCPSPEIASVATKLRHAQGELGALMAGVAALEEKRRIFNAYLRQDLREHALLLRLDADAWVVQTEAAVWAMRLRYALFDIREALSAHCGFALPKPQIRVVPNTEVPAAPAPKRCLTPQTGRALQELARNEADAQLQAALLRLAGRSAS